MARIKIRRALISVSDKSGVIELARGLVKHHAQLISTGGTYRALVDADIPVEEVSSVTDLPEMLDGRVKTLHPAVHGGILYRRDLTEHVATVHEMGYGPIDLVAVNLYPFEQTVARPDVSLDEAIENIDIGGPAMIRSAAKNHAFVAVLTDPSQYAELLAELDEGEGAVSTELLRKLAVTAFARTARYDAAINAFLEKSLSGAAAFPSRLALSYERRLELRYGENPHQSAAFYVEDDAPAGSLALAKQRHGKELSYNNLLDLDAALGLSREFALPAVVIIKHNNPCGVAVAEELVTAFARAWESDPVSAFGSVIGVNRAVDAATAEALVEPGRFVEAIIAPAFSPEAMEILTTRPTWKKNVRLLETGPLTANAENSLTIRPVDGGLLVQTPDAGRHGFEDRRLVTKRSPTAAELADLEFAWIVAKHVKSNAIVLVKGRATVGVGAGQMSRVDATHLAARKAGSRVKGSVLASDAFFPFRDNVDEAAAVGVTALVQPGGSMRDQESIDAADENGMAMLFTGMRHFRH